MLSWWRPVTDIITIWPKRRHNWSNWESPTPGGGSPPWLLGTWQRNQALRLARGVEVDGGTLALDLIQEVGFEGNYLDQKHTVRHFRNEHYLPELLVRDPYETWEQAGSRPALERAKARVREILEEHQPRELDPALVQALDAYRQRVAERDLNDFYLGELAENQDWDDL